MHTRTTLGATWKTGTVKWRSPKAKIVAQRTLPLCCASKSELSELQEADREKVKCMAATEDPWEERLRLPGCHCEPDSLFLMHKASQSDCE